MTAFDSSLSGEVQALADSGPLADVRPLLEQRRLSAASAHQVGWVPAFVWPAAASALVAGCLLGDRGHLLVWVGAAGVLAMFVRQAVKIVRRNVRDAGQIIDNAPGARREREGERVYGRYGSDY